MEASQLCFSLKLNCTVDIGPNNWKYDIHCKIAFPSSISSTLLFRKRRFNYMERRVPNGRKVYLDEKFICSSRSPESHKTGASRKCSLRNMDNIVGIKDN